MHYDGYILMKKLIASALATASTLSIAGTAFAGVGVDPCAPGNQTGGTDFTKLCALSASGIGKIVQTGVTILLIAAVLISLFYLIWGGIRWITSGGDKGKVDEARKHIVAAIIGLIVSFLAYFILQVVLGFFGLSLSSLVLPTIVAP